MAEGSDIATIVKGGTDPLGRSVVDVLAREQDRYAVYLTEERVVILYADDPMVQRIQRKRLATLAPTRAAIDAMLAGWRGEPSAYSRLPATARQYDGEVGAALVTALEGETEAALAALNQVKASVAGEMASRARLTYVAWTLFSAVLVLIASFIIFLLFNAYDRTISPTDHDLLMKAVLAGVLGAVYSIALRIQSRDLRDDARRFDSFTDSFVRIGIGALGAFILGCFLLSGAIEIHFGEIGALGDGGGGTINPGATTRNSVFLLLIAGFVAGFVERMVPDLLNSYAVTAAPPPPVPSTPTATTPPAGAAAASATVGKDEARKADEGGLPGEGSAREDEDALVTPASPEEHLDGCDIDLADPAQTTSDEDLPPATGRVASGPSA
ncbi:hypothetical protein [Sphingomonas sp. ID0503]|uniref:hypothetical protein n=1 Tax=Sphingomonas sp. ID0503 TaxID=3399691 RepID=UPI003AFA10EE